MCLGWAWFPWPCQGYLRPSVCCSGFHWYYQGVLGRVGRLWLTWISLAVPRLSYVPRFDLLLWLTWIPLALPMWFYVPRVRTCRSSLVDMDSIGYAKVVLCA
jgi:hypothetical protein